MNIKTYRRTDIKKAEKLTKVKSYKFCHIYNKQYPDSPDFSGGQTSFASPQTRYDNTIYTPTNSFGQSNIVNSGVNSYGQTHNVNSGVNNYGQTQIVNSGVNNYGQAHNVNSGAGSYGHSNSANSGIRKEFTI